MFVSVSTTNISHKYNDNYLDNSCCRLLFIGAESAITTLATLAFNKILLPTKKHDFLRARPNNNSGIFLFRKFLLFSELYRCTHPERLANAGIKTEEDDGTLICSIIPDVYIHPTASVHPTATVSDPERNLSMEL